LIRTLHFSDFLKLGRLHEAEVGLNLPDALVIPNSPISAALIQRLPVHILSSSVYIHEEDGKPSAFAQANTRRRSEEWNVLTLGIVDPSGRSKNEETSKAADSDMTEPQETVALVELEEAIITDGSIIEDEENETEDPEEEIIRADLRQLPDDIEIAWLKLLEYMVMDAGEKGVVRIYAKLSTESAELSLFNQIGFHSYTHESLYTLRYEVPVERPGALKVRPQRGRDNWFINQLYIGITPNFVQMQEQNTARDWEIPKGYFPRSVKETGWVLEEGEKIVAYIRITSNRHKTMLRIMNFDSHRQQLPELLRFALSTLKVGPQCQVYCVVREYQAEQEGVLEEAGFSFFGKQAVMVKHTVQFVRGTERALSLVRDRKLELARWVRPNFLIRLFTKLPFHYFNL